MSEAVLYKFDGATATLTMNQAEQLNALGSALVTGLNNGLDRAKTDSARHIVFKSAGRAFSAGLDLSGLDDASDGDLLLRLVRIEQLLQRIRHCDCATIALVHGACYGAAADLVLCCRTRIASADARFSMPGLRFGIVLGTRRLRDVLGEPTAYQLLDRSKPFSAAEALETGFINDIVETGQWADAVERIAQKLANFSAAAYANRVASLTPDTRAEDMQALVSSITADSTEDSIKSRMQEYVSTVKAERKARQ